MRHVRMLGLCVIAVFAVSAIAAATASAALPEWGQCYKKGTIKIWENREIIKYEGKYSNPGCTEPVAKGEHGKYEGEYEWRKERKGEGRVLRNTQGDPITFETPSKTIECTEGKKYRFEVMAPKSISNGYLAFQGCHEVGGAAEPCETPGEEPGIINNVIEYTDEEGIVGTLGYLAGKGTENPKVGLSFTSPKKGGVLMKVKCNEASEVFPIDIGGEKKSGNSVISSIEPVDQMTEEFTQTFEGSGGIQEWTAFESSTKKLALMEFTGSTWEQSAWKSTLTIPSEEPIEIRAYIK